VSDRPREFSPELVKRPEAVMTRKQAYALSFALCRRFGLPEPSSRLQAALLIGWLRAGGEGEPPRAEEEAE
jgi:hypothetical protein